MEEQEETKIAFIAQKDRFQSKNMTPAYWDSKQINLGTKCISKYMKVYEQDGIKL